jgi:KDO2-lipid IV(A) lauroyltransferase
MVTANQSIFFLLRYRMPKTTFKKLRYWFGNILGNVLLTLSLLIFRGQPLIALVFISKILGTMAFYLFKKYRERVVGNLFIAFGREKDLKEIKSIAKEVFFHFTLTPLESVYAYANPFEQFLLKIKIKGKEYLDAALAQGKGVIALGAHLGPFTLVGARLSVEGYPFNLVINEGNYPKLWKRFGIHQRRLGQNPFPLKPISSSIKKSLNCLHRNEILYLIADEQQRRGGVSVPFFGQGAFTPPGPAIFSLKTGAPILPMFILRENGIKRTLVIGSPIEIERTSDEKKDIEALIGKFTKAIEDIVRHYPSQWAWLNRRWKLPHQKGTLDTEIEEV